MSLLETVLAGLTFRTATPAFEVGEEFTAYVTGTDETGALVRIGDSVLRLGEGDESLVDRRVRLRVEAFDAEAHEGRAELRSVVDAD
jgi:hypothetical protein